MLRVWEGYEGWATWSGNHWNAFWNTATAGASQSFITGRYGSPSIAWRGNATSGGNSGFASHHKYGFTSPSSNDFVIGLAIRVVSSSGTRTVCCVSEGGAAGTRQFEVAIGINTGGFHSIIINRAGTTVATATAAFSTNAWHYIEVKGRIHDTTGYAVIKVDGVEVLNSTGLDTRNAGTGLWDGVYFGPSIFDNQNYVIDIDDMYLVEIDGSGANDFLGEVREEALAPTGAGNSTQFTPNAGSNWDRVDEVGPDDDTTYNASSTVGHKDTFAMANVSISPASVLGVREILRARKTDAGERFLRSVLRIDGSEYEGSDRALSPTYQTWVNDRTLSPDSGVAFTTSEIDALEAGYTIES